MLDKASFLFVWPRTGRQSRSFCIVAVHVDRRHLRNVRIVWLTATVLCLGPALQAAPAGDPYATICQRDPFHLKPPPAVSVQAPHEPLPRIHLTGITTILGGKRALFKVELPGKPLDKAESYILTEGQKAGDLEVLRIDEKAALVKVDYSGTITNLTFDKLPPSAPVARPKPAPRWRAVTYPNPYRRIYR